jgi:hypothetical protein
MQLLLTENQHVIQTLAPNTPQKAFTDGIGARCVIGCFQYLDAARCCLSLTFRRRASPLTDLRSGYLLTIRLKFPSYLDFLFAMGYACLQKIIYLFR